MVKRGLPIAIAVVLLLVMLGVTMVGEHMNTNKCRAEMTLILPDGAELPLHSGPGYVAGSSASVVGLQGFGLPPVDHVTQEVYDMPGVLLRDVKVGPRVVDVVLSLWSRDGTRHGLHRTRAQLLDAFRWDRGATDTALTTLRYTLNGVSRETYLTYDGVVESQLGRHGLNETWAVRFLVPDPMWWDDAESSQVLGWEDTFTSRYILARIDGSWDPMGPPAAVGAGILATGVYTIAVHPTTGDICLGGDFTNWDNIAAADMVVMWDVSAQAWVAVGGGLNNAVNKLLFASDGTLFAGGLFTNGSGGAGDANADYVAQLDTITNTWVNVGGGPGVGVVLGVGDLAQGFDGILYILGEFTNWQGNANSDHVVAWDGAAWSNLSTGLNNLARAGVILSNGNLVMGGGFTTAGGVACNRIAQWDGTAFTALSTGMNNVVSDVAVAPNGMVYTVGMFTTAGGSTVNYVASWNGTSWSDLDGGLDAVAWQLAVGADGVLYVVGAFTQAGPLTLTDRVAAWNGYSWIRIPFDLPGAPTVWSVALDGQDLYFGWGNVGAVAVAGGNSVVNEGSAFALPIIEVKNYGFLQSIRNETMGYDIPCDMLIQDGEIVTVDLSTGRKTVTSTWRGNRLGDVLPNSDLGTFKLESAPRAQYGGVDGANLITVFITGAADPREHNDGGNQLSGWDGITGISQQNTNLGILYASIVVVGGGFNRLDLYMDPARTELVGQTANYNAPGAQAIVPQNASGLGGTITIDAVGAGDVDIFAYYTIVTMSWRSRWWDLDSAVMA